MWQKIRWIFPVIFAGIVIFKIYGHFQVHKPAPLPRTLADRFSKEPRAGAIGQTFIEVKDPDEADDSEETDEAPEPPRNHLPIALVATAVGLTVGYLGFRRVWLR